ncbi:MAG: HEPN domain-containing protein [Deferrisomatales bacterium]|nr:HEPN domain-containing protein [Deferrisomatales bacterium]
MTSTTLAQSYLLKASTRLRVLEVLMEEEAWSDVVREAQELVELALKGMLRQVGIDPPKWHDVGPILEEHAARLPPECRLDLPALVETSRWLRREREFAFYGDVDFIPTEEYRSEDALRALEGARLALDAARRLIPAP